MSYYSPSTSPGTRTILLYSIELARLLIVRSLLREHGAPLRSACVALGAPPCATGGHGEVLFAYLTPRKRAPKRVAEGGP